ncbi:MAG: hypothetical protein ACREUG_00505 [Steroidobacteraceae bacterium]
MGTAGWMVRGMRLVTRRNVREPPLRVLELGAGDGTLRLRIARRRSRSWPTGALTLIDRPPLIDAGTRAAFARQGWPAQSSTVDVLDWAVASSPDSARWDVIVTNLFLHHFEPRPLRTLLSAVAARCDLFVACEPRRSMPALIGSHLVGALGAGRVAREDAVLSVHAGFRDEELSALWPGERGAWRMQERAAGLFSHFFCAARRGGGVAEAAETA